MRAHRVAGWFLIAKVCVAAALLGALTLPFATCYTSGRTIDLSDKLIDWPSFANAFLMFGWPLPLIVFQIIALSRGRHYRTVLAIECLAALVSSWQLEMQVMAMAVLTFGSAAMGPGWVLATDCDLGYFLLAALELAYSAIISRAPSSRTRIVTST